MEMYENRAVVPESRWSRRALRAPVGVFCLWLVTVMGLAESGARAQDCALKVKVDKKDPVAYQARGNGCEGTYDQPTANRIKLRIVGFHLGVPVFDPRKDDIVRITVRPHEVERKILLRVISTRRHANFQMDTSSIGADGTFTWRLVEVVRRLAEPLMPFETAALACGGDCESGRPILLPVSLSGAAAAGESPATLTVLAMADVELSSLTATLRQGDKILFEDLAVGGRNLAPGKPFRIPIDRVEAGKALFSLSAITLRGQRDYFEAVLLIPARGQ